VGDVVLLKDETAAGNTYKLARVTEVFRDEKDDRVRKVSVAYKNVTEKVFRVSTRPIHKIVWWFLLKMQICQPFRLSGPPEKLEALPPPAGPQPAQPPPGGPPEKLEALPPPGGPPEKLETLPPPASPQPAQPPPGSPPEELEALPPPAGSQLVQAPPGGQKPDQLPCRDTSVNKTVRPLFPGGHLLGSADVDPPDEPRDAQLDAGGPPDGPAGDRTMRGRLRPRRTFYSWDLLDRMKKT
jgi:Family of unknown function (DUF5641)